MLRELKENLIDGIIGTAGSGILIVLLLFIIPAIFFEAIHTLSKQIAVGWESYSRGDKVATLIMAVIISGVIGLVLDCIYEQFILISYKYNIETTTLVSILVFYCLISNIIWTKNKLKTTN